jgi:hypothetical protein
MNGAATFDDKLWRRVHDFAAHTDPVEEAMTSSWISFFAMLFVSLGVYHWLDHLLYPRPQRRRSTDGSGGDFGGSSDGGGWSFGDWFGSSSDSSDGDGDSGGGDGGD